MTFDVLIHFIDGSEKKITGVTTYALNPDSDTFRIEKNGYNILIPFNNVLYIGRVFDLKD